MGISIQRDEQSYAYCDFCSYTEEYDGTFSQIVQGMREDGWSIFREDGEWYHRCPDCCNE